MDDKNKPTNKFRDTIPTPAEEERRNQLLLMKELRVRTQISDRARVEFADTIALLQQVRSEAVMSLPCERKEAMLEHLDKQIRAMNEQEKAGALDVPPKDKITLALLEEKFAEPEAVASEGEDTETSEELKEE